MTQDKRKTTKIPMEFDRWIKNIQRQIYNETNEIYTKAQILRVISNSKVKIRRKKRDDEIGLGF